MAMCLVEGRRISGGGGVNGDWAKRVLSKREAYACFSSGEGGKNLGAVGFFGEGAASLTRRVNTMG